MKPRAKQIHAILQDYRGLPLTSADLAEELGVDQHTVNKYTRALHEQGVIRRWRDPTGANDGAKAPYLHAVLEAP